MLALCSPGHARLSDHLGSGGLPAAFGHAKRSQLRRTLWTRRPTTERIKHVRGRHDSDESSALEHRQATDDAAAHEVGRLAKCHSRRSADYARAHQLFDGPVLSRFLAMAPA
jgi:hypothetical protein